MQPVDPQKIKSAAAASADVALRNVLVVDDSPAQRRSVTAALDRWGYAVIEAGSGDEALRLCAEAPVDLILSDWMMPGMDGPEFCRAFRALERDSYGYFILLTSKSGTDEVAHGLDAGADDFLTKPVNHEELRARIHAGERVLGMEGELKHKNALLTDTLDQLQQLYDALERDLAQARELQQSLLSEHFPKVPGAHVSLLLHPSGHLGGDLVGYYPVNATRLGLFALDVSGHGVNSALMTARLAGMLSGGTPERNIALFTAPDGSTAARHPAEVLGRMNRLLLEEIGTDLYFTIVLADVELETGQARLVQAGHPHPALQRSDGSIALLGGGGLPVGLVPDADWDEVALQLAPGDRLLLMSDGITECAAPDGTEFGEDGAKRLMTQLRELRGGAFNDALIAALQRHAGTRDFSDDISSVLFELVRDDP